MSKCRVVIPKTYIYDINHAQECDNYLDSRDRAPTHVATSSSLGGVKRFSNSNTTRNYRLVISI